MLLLSVGGQIALREGDESGLLGMSSYIHNQHQHFAIHFEMLTS